MRIMIFFAIAALLTSSPARAADKQNTRLDQISSLLEHYMGLSINRKNLSQPNVIRDDKGEMEWLSVVINFPPYPVSREICDHSYLLISMEFESASVSRIDKRYQKLFSPNNEGCDPGRLVMVEDGVASNPEDLLVHIYDLLDNASRAPTDEICQFLVEVAQCQLVRQYLSKPDLLWLTAINRFRGRDRRFSAKLDLTINSSVGPFLLILDTCKGIEGVPLQIKAIANATLTIQPDFRKKIIDAKCKYAD